jgi:hypothetical protein
MSLFPSWQTVHWPLTASILVPASLTQEVCNQKSPVELF